MVYPFATPAIIAQHFLQGKFFHGAFHTVLFTRCFSPALLIPRLLRMSFMRMKNRIPDDLIAFLIATLSVALLLASRGRSGPASSLAFVASNAGIFVAFLLWWKHQRAADRQILAKLEQPSQGAVIGDQRAVARQQKQLRQVLLFERSMWSLLWLCIGITLALKLL